MAVCALVAVSTVSTVSAVGLPSGSYADAGARLSAAEVQLIIAQAVGRAQRLGVAATVAVADREGNVLGVFQMDGARAGVTILGNGVADPDGLEQVTLPLGAAAAAASKAGTAATLSSDGGAFTTRTASFIIQEHFPPTVSNFERGPLFGVQFSQLPCSDVRAGALPLGPAGDPGGLPLYKNGVAAGGVGVEVDGRYDTATAAANDVEEDVALAAAWGFEAPAAIHASQISVGGVTLPYVYASQASDHPASLAGGVMLVAVRPAPAPRYQAITLGGRLAKADPRFFPPRAGAGLTAGDVTRILAQALQQAFVTRAGIRLPIASPTEVNVTVVDADGAILGIASTQDAPEFGFDVSAQKARTAAFFSRADAGARLRAAGQARFADAAAAAAAASGIMLDGGIAFSSRAIGFLSTPVIPGAPFAQPSNVYSPYNNGLQLALVRSAFLDGASGAAPSACTALPGLRDGMQIHAGGVPLYRDGAIGVSGDGIDQDDAISQAGGMGFEPPPAITSDHVVVHGVRLPYVKLPSRPAS